MPRASGPRGQAMYKESAMGHTRPETYPLSPSFGAQNHVLPPPSAIAQGVSYAGVTPDATGNHKSVWSMARSLETVSQFFPRKFGLIR